MIVVESALLTTLFAVLAVSGYTDCMTGVIRNKILLVCGGIGTALDTLYYLTWGRDYFTLFLANLVLLVIVSVLFYAYYLWAAGDSKLLFLVGILIPGRLYLFWNIGTVPSFVIVVFTFSFAFLYVVAESILLSIRDHASFHVSLKRLDFVRIIASYLAMVASTTIFNLLLMLVFQYIQIENTILFMALDFMLVLTLIRIRDRLSTSILGIAAVTGAILLTVLACTGIVRIRGSFDWKSWLIVFAILFFRLIAERYNYRTIPTSEVKKGQILSAATIAGFTASRVQGLPTGLTEDLRSRLSESEAESVRRWEKSAHGKPDVVIVRKIPFAIFIGIGTVCFVVLEVAFA